jgi:hypothetical protein
MIDVDEEQYHQEPQIRHIASVTAWGRVGVIPWESGLLRTWNQGTVNNRHCITQRDKT